VADQIVIKTIKSFLKRKRSSNSPLAEEGIFMSMGDEAEPKVLKTDEADDENEGIKTEEALSTLDEGVGKIKADEVEDLVSKSSEPVEDPELEELKMSSKNDLDDSNESSDEDVARRKPASRARSRRKSDAETKEKTGSRRSKKAMTAAELLEQEVPVRASASGDNLRVSLAGSVVVQLEGSKTRHVFDWSSAELKADVTEQDKKGDCLIRLSEENLMRISRGELNPQISMLTNKIKVEGKNELAIYFFNLIAPRDSV